MPRAFSRAGVQHEAVPSDASTKARPASPALLLTLALTGCSGFGSPGDLARGVVELDSVGYSVFPKQRDDVALGAQAILDLPCPAGVVAKNLSGNTGGSGFRVEGCGQAITYVALEVWGDSSSVPAYPREKVRVKLRRFVPVSRDGADAALSTLERNAASIALQNYLVDRSAITPWVDLYKAASRDLPCPRESLSVDIVGHGRAPSTYLAEGCGARGLFVRNSAGAFVITSRVALTPGQ
jgi:hypothetical protein